jgi:hypothetical protein
LLWRGNRAAQTHGAYSERRIQPLAEEILETARRSPDWPNWLDDESYSAAIAAWAHYEAVCMPLRDYLGERDILQRPTPCRNWLLRPRKCRLPEFPIIRAGSAQVVDPATQVPSTFDHAFGTVEQKQSAQPPKMTELARALLL